MGGRWGERRGLIDLLLNEAADAVCREVRFQMAKNGGIVDNIKLFEHLEKWMALNKDNSKYTRP